MDRASQKYNIPKTIVFGWEGVDGRVEGVDGRVEVKGKQLV